jgi:DUF1009 family protein
MEERPIGIIAGSGQFPLMIARAARAQGKSVVAVAHISETWPELESEVSEIHWVRLGQLGKIISVFKKFGVTDVIMAGAISKTKLYSKALPDLKGLSLLTRLKEMHDDGILRAVASVLEADGIKVRASTMFLPELAARLGVYTARKPNKRQASDISVGFKIAKEVGKLDIGQTVVVRRGAVVALEAMEGTDACILRGGQLADRDAVVVKVSKPHQDMRFDQPAVGLKTIETMIKARAAVLAIEAGKTIFFDVKKSISLADEHKMVVVGVES